MPYSPDVHHRRSLRLPLADYSQAGAYFVTLCTFARQPLLGCIVDEKVVLSDVGRLVAGTWQRLPQTFPHVTIDSFVVMPNHLHAIISLQPSEHARMNSGVAVTSVTVPRGTARGSLQAIVQNYKSVTPRRYNRMNPLATTLWQRNYYEHIVRDDTDLDRIRAYIDANPANWSQDAENAHLDPSGS